MVDKKDATNDSFDLKGRLLLAMPGMGDSRFHKAAILVCAHDENGAMGLVINHTLPGIGMEELLKQLDISTDNRQTEKPVKDIPVMSGGPVETARGFILHSTDFAQDDTIKVNDDFCVTGTIDALKAISTGNGPHDMIFILGYAGWSPGQLDQEIQQNAWLVLDADQEIVFEKDPEKIWAKAIGKLGIDPAMLSGEAGHA